MDKIYDWLLEKDNPAIQYRTMVELLDTPRDSPDAARPYQAIWATKDVQKMLERQNPDGVWEHDEYGVQTPLRYLTAFAEQGVHRDERLDRAVDDALDFLIGNETADMAHDYSGCGNALILRALVRLGYHEDSRVVTLLGKYAASQLDDGGFICRRLLAKRPGRKSCYKADLAALLLYAECHRRKIELPNTDQLLGYFLKRDVFYHREDKAKMVLEGKPGWRVVDNFFPVEPMRIGLPLIVAALAVLGAGDHPALARAWEFLEAKKNANGRFVLEGTLSKQPCKFGKVGEENKWVTFYALMAEKYRKVT